MLNTVLRVLGCAVLFIAALAAFRTYQATLPMYSGPGSGFGAAVVFIFLFCALGYVLTLIQDAFTSDRSVGPRIVLDVISGLIAAAIWEFRDPVFHWLFH